MGGLVFFLLSIPTGIIVGITANVLTKTATEQHSPVLRAMTRGLGHLDKWCRRLGDFLGKRRALGSQTRTNLTVSPFQWQGFSRNLEVRTAMLPLSDRLLEFIKDSATGVVNLLKQHRTVAVTGHDRTLIRLIAQSLAESEAERWHVFFFNFDCASSANIAERLLYQLRKWTTQGGFFGAPAGKEHVRDPHTWIQAIEAVPDESLVVLLNIDRVPANAFFAKEQSVFEAAKRGLVEKGIRLLVSCQSCPEWLGARGHSEVHGIPGELFFSAYRFLDERPGLEVIRTWSDDERALPRRIDLLMVLSAFRGQHPICDTLFDTLQRTRPEYWLKSAAEAAFRAFPAAEKERACQVLAALNFWREPFSAIALADVLQDLDHSVWDPPLVHRILDEAHRFGLVEVVEEPRDDNRYYFPCDVLRDLVQSADFAAARSYIEQHLQAGKVGPNSVSDEGLTVLTSYLTQRDFFYSGDLLGLYLVNGGRAECFLPLTTSLVRIAKITDDSARLGSIVAKLYQYDWNGNPGTGNLVIVLSPDNIHAESLFRIRVHVASKSGSGSQVVDRVKEVADEILHLQGDAHRCGPGGYVELLVRLKRTYLEKVNCPGLTPDEAKERREELKAELERLIREPLEHSLDPQVLVRVEQCMPIEVKDDLACSKLAWADGLSIEQTDLIGYGHGFRHYLRIAGEALTALTNYLQLTPTKGFSADIRFQCFTSMLTLQAFLVVQRPTRANLVRVMVSGKTPIDPGGDTIHQERTAPAQVLMKQGASMGFDLLSLRQGMDGTFFAEAQMNPRTTLVELQSELGKHLNIQVSSLPLSSFVAGGDLRVFGSGKPLAPSGLVNTPEVYHTLMRKHLFIPDSDIAAVTMAATELAKLRTAGHRDPRVLELGIGTGALTEKLIAAGLLPLDMVEPDPALYGSFTQRAGDRAQVLDSKRTAIEGVGILYKMTCEEFFEFARDTSQYDLLVSQGLHHHIGEQTADASGAPKDGDHRATVMAGCADLLSSRGSYVLSDEFVSKYSDDVGRVRNLDQWYRYVIATALADGFLELAEMEYGFWQSDRDNTNELKESFECFVQRLERIRRLQINNVVKFGFTERCPGGFVVMTLSGTLQPNDTEST